MRDAAIDSPRQTGRGAPRQRVSGAPPLEGMLGEGPVARAGTRKGSVTSAAIAAQRLGGGRAGFGVGRGRASPGLVARLRDRMPRVKPFRAVTVGVFSLALVGIVANAMVFQRGRHPAPLFGLGQSVDGQGEAAQRSTASPTPAPQAPAERTGTISPAPAPAVVPAVVPAAAAPKPVPVHHAAAKLHREDAAGVPAKAGSTVPAHPRPGHTVAKVEARPESKPDAVAKLLAQPPHTEKSPPAGTATAKVEAKPVAHPVAKALPVAKAGPVAKPGADAKPAVAKVEHDRPIESARASASHPRHRVAATDAPADAAKKAVKPE